MAKKQESPDVAEVNIPSFEQKLANIAKKNGLKHHQQPEPSIQSDDTRKMLAIKKAKIVSDMTLDVEYHEQITLIHSGGTRRKDIGGTIKREGDNAVHDDLRTAFKKLNVHLALIAEMINFSGRDIEEIEERNWKDFSVTGFSCGGGDEGITLIGQKALSTGKVLNLTTPYLAWENSDYQYIDDLGQAIEACKHEVEQYLGGKMAPAAQQEMEFETTDESPQLLQEQHVAQGHDELLREAAMLVVISQSGSTSLIQRRLKIGFNRAGMIIDKLEALKIVGPFKGDKVREVLICDVEMVDKILGKLK